MKKNIYITLLVVAIIVLGYTGYYSYTKTTIMPPPSIVATSTQDITTETPREHTTTLVTQTGKTITIQETNPVGESLSTIAITTSGFATNSPIILEKNKLTKAFLLDLNKDTFDELIIITTSVGSGTYSEATLFTTAHDEKLTPVLVPIITEDDTKKGSLFEGYFGHDTFTATSGMLIREFPLPGATNTVVVPSEALTRKILYTLTEKDGLPAISFTQENQSSTTTSEVSVTATSSSKQLPLTGTSWVWTSLTASGTTKNAPQGDAFVLTFDTNTSMHSTTDCNTLRGEYLTSKDTIRFGAMMTTKMFCEGSQEMEYSSLLTKARFYKLQNQELLFILSDKNTVTFKQKK